VPVHQTILGHGVSHGTTTRAARLRSPGAAFDFRRQFVLNGTHAEYDRCVTMQRPIISEGVSPDVTPNSRCCTPGVTLTDFAMMKQRC
jgi:hypothetical protein